MPRVSVQHCLNDFVQDMQGARDLLRDAHGYYTLRTGGNYQRIRPERIHLIAALALFKMQLSWEDFLENTFTRYMCGATSASGYAPNLVSASPESTIANALTRLLGSRQYINWTPTTTLNLANMYFVHAQPYSTIGLFRSTIDDMALVRNAFAHRSDFALLSFRGVMRRALGYVPRNMSPGKFLLTTDPTAAVVRTFYDTYENTLLNAASQIVP